MKVSYDKQNGDITFNYIRQMLLTGIDVFRPIAFKINETTTIVSPDENIMEDSVEISNNLCNYKYDIDTTDDYYELKLRTSELKASDLNRDAVKVLDIDKGDTIIAHSLAGDMEIIIFFRKFHGIASIQENANFLSKHLGTSNYADNIVILNARFCNYDRVYWKEISTNEAEDTRDLVIESTYPVDCEKAFKEVMSICSLNFKY